MTAPSSATEPSLRDAETRGHLIRWAGFYDRLMSVLTLGNEARFRRNTVAAAHLRPSERVLDVGCGTGTLALAAADAVGEGGEVVGIDPSAAMIAQARDKARRTAGRAPSRGPDDLGRVAALASELGFEAVTQERFRPKFLTQLHARVPA